MPFTFSIPSFWFCFFPLFLFSTFFGDFCRWFRSPSVKWVCFFLFLGAVFSYRFCPGRFLPIFWLLFFLYSVIRRIWEKTRCSTMISLLLLFAFSNTLNIRFETFRMNTFFSYFMLHDLFFFLFKEGGLGYNLTLLYRKMPSDFITRVPIKVGRAWEDGHPAHTWIVSLLFGQI